MNNGSSTRVYPDQPSNPQHTTIRQKVCHSAYSIPTDLEEIVLMATSLVTNEIKTGLWLVPNATLLDNDDFDDYYYSDDDLNDNPSLSTITPPRLTITAKDRTKKTEKEEKKIKTVVEEKGKDKQYINDNEGMKEEQEEESISSEKKIIRTFITKDETFEKNNDSTKCLKNNGGGDDSNREGEKEEEDDGDIIAKPSVVSIDTTTASDETTLKRKTTITNSSSSSSKEIEKEKVKVKGSNRVKHNTNLEKNENIDTIDDEREGDTTTTTTTHNDVLPQEDEQQPSMKDDTIYQKKIIEFISSTINNDTGEERDATTIQEDDEEQPNEGEKKVSDDSYEKGKGEGKKVNQRDIPLPQCSNKSKTQSITTASNNNSPLRNNNNHGEGGIIKSIQKLIKQIPNSSSLTKVKATKTCQNLIHGCDNNSIVDNAGNNDRRKGEMKPQQENEQPLKQQDGISSNRNLGDRRGGGGYNIDKEGAQEQARKKISSVLPLSSSIAVVEVVSHTSLQTNDANIGSENTAYNVDDLNGVDSCNEDKMKSHSQCISTVTTKISDSNYDQFVEATKKNDNDTSDGDEVVLHQGTTSSTTTTTTKIGDTATIIKTTTMSSSSDAIVPINKEKNNDDDDAVSAEKYGSPSNTVFTTITAAINNNVLEKKTTTSPKEIASSSISSTKKHENTMIETESIGIETTAAINKSIHVSNNAIEMDKEKITLNNKKRTKQNLKDDTDQYKREHKKLSQLKFKSSTLHTACPPTNFPTTSTITKSRTQVPVSSFVDNDNKNNHDNNDNYIHNNNDVLTQLHTISGALETFAIEVVLPTFRAAGAGDSIFDNDGNISGNGKEGMEMADENGIINKTATTFTTTSCNKSSFGGLNNVSSHDVRGTSQRVFVATLLVLREVLAINADSIFFIGDEYSNDDKDDNHSIDHNVIDDDHDDSTKLKKRKVRRRKKNYPYHFYRHNEEQEAFKVQLLTTGLMLSAIGKLGHYSQQQQSSEVIMNQFQQAVSKYDTADEEFTSCLERADGRSMNILPNGKILGHEENIAWKVGFNYGRDRHPLIVGQRLQETTERSKHTLSKFQKEEENVYSFSSNNHKKKRRWIESPQHVAQLADANACIVSVVEKSSIRYDKQAKEENEDIKDWNEYEKRELNKHESKLNTIRRMHSEEGWGD